MVTRRRIARVQRSVVGAALLLGLSMAAGCEEAREPELTLVPARYVCMVTDRFFGRDQIPVEVGDRTYFGCCAGCEAKLRGDASVRASIDPISGRAVDKATAVIGALPDGGVVYFENEGNLARFRRNPRS